MTSFLVDWRWWLIILLIAATGYVQDVGTHFEKASGLQRLANLQTYHGLFRGLPWLLFRYGGIIRLVAIVTILLIHGWRAAVVSGVSVFFLSFALRRITRQHALTMLEQVGKR